MKRSSISAAAKAHIGRVKELPCAVCGITGETDAHHILEGRIPGRRSGDFCVIPLCHSGCHQGPQGIHGDRTLWRIYKATELGCLDDTLNALYGHIK